MIVKFDHISYSCKTGKEEEIVKKLQGYEIVFFEKNLDNLPIKKQLLASPAEKHNIMLLNSATHYPVEITAYEFCNKDYAKYEIVGEDILVYTFNPEKTMDYFEKSGFEKTEEFVLTVKPVLDTKPVKLRIVNAPECENPMYLDNEGYGSLAFVVDNAVKQKKLLDSRDIYTTDIQELVVNGKKLKIFFSKSETGEIIEYIGLSR